MPPSQHATDAIRRLATHPWHGDAWRIHGIDLTASRRAGRRVYYEPTSDGGSRRKSGRYHRAPDYFPIARVWPALYTSLTDGACLAEAIRHAGSLTALEALRMTVLHIRLSVVLDLTDPSSYGLRLENVIDDDDYTITQEIGLAALQRGVEGILVPAASLVGTNLVILTENLLPDSIVEAGDSIDPRLRGPTR